MTEFKITEEELKKKAEQISDEDVEKVLENKEEIISDCKGPLKALVNEIKLFFFLIRDFTSGRYKTVPRLSIALMVFTLLYVLMPFDSIPDVIPFVGLMDDALVVAICIVCVKKDLLKYEEWKSKED